MKSKSSIKLLYGRNAGFIGVVKHHRAGRIYYISPYGIEDSLTDFAYMYSHPDYKPPYIIHNLGGQPQGKFIKSYLDFALKHPNGTEEGGSGSLFVDSTGSKLVDGVVENICPGSLAKLIFGALLFHRNNRNNWPAGTEADSQAAENLWRFQNLPEATDARWHGGKLVEAARAHGPIRLEVTEIEGSWVITSKHKKSFPEIIAYYERERKSEAAKPPSIAETMRAATIPRLRSETELHEYITNTLASADCEESESLATALVSAATFKFSQRVMGLTTEQITSASIKLMQLVLAELALAH